LTRRIEDAVFEEIAKVDAIGGALRAIETGYFQRVLAKEQYERHMEIESGRRKLVGVNHLAQPGEKRGIELFALDPEVERRQVERLRAVKASRDSAAVARALERVREAARGSDNLVPPILEAVKLYATQGEICDAMRDVFGVYHPDSLTTGV
jgi:methylmalonyl-CoA mutase N-terminal domain/subunit